VVGNLLLVESDAVAPAADAAAFALVLADPATHGAPGGPGPQLMALPGGRHAEVWAAKDIPV
jgi:hypothetical protein